MCVWFFFKKLVWLLFNDFSSFIAEQGVKKLVCMSVYLSYSSFVFWFSILLYSVDSCISVSVNRSFVKLRVQCISNISPCYHH